MLVIFYLLISLLVLLARLNFTDKVNLIFTYILFFNKQIQKASAKTDSKQVLFGIYCLIILFVFLPCFNFFSQIKLIDFSIKVKMTPTPSFPI